MRRPDDAGRRDNNKLVLLSSRSRLPFPTASQCVVTLERREVAAVTADQTFSCARPFLSFSTLAHSVLTLNESDSKGGINHNPVTKESRGERRVRRGKRVTGNVKRAKISQSLSFFFLLCMFTRCVCEFRV